MQRYQQIKKAIWILLVMVLSGCVHVNAGPEKLRGIWHEVGEGDDASKIAKKYKTDETLIIELNDLNHDGSIKNRQIVFVPTKDGKAPGDATAPVTSIEKKQQPQSTVKKIEGKCGRDGRPCFLWPAPGRVSALFGPRKGGHHDGLDVVSVKGTQIVAAFDGTVIYSGNEIKGYGNLIIVRHKDGIITVYAHNDKNLVKENTRVKQGDPIGRMGATGSAGGVHLHFEVRVNETPIDPLLYLPSKEANQ